MKSSSRVLILWLLFNASSVCSQQAPPLTPPDERYKADILLVVAHPDDETAISSYLARAIFDQHKRVAVVYGTRGDGGGNLVGNEQAASLGAVREIEARRALASYGIMNVWFIGAPDTPGQDVLRSLETWRHGNALEQVVRLVRLTRPEVIITWLPCYVAGENHDDHQAAAVIATEAFGMSGDPTAFPSQVAAPRQRLRINNYGEGLLAWQAKKLYYFSDADHTDFLEGKGPQYKTTDVSPARKVPYYRLSADEWSFHETQRGVGDVARSAIEKGDFSALKEPERFVLGKSLVKSTTSGDIFEGVTPGAIAYAPRNSYRPLKQEGVSLRLGGPWEFYREFWRAHDIEHLAGLVTPEVGVAGGQTLNVPLLISNETDQGKLIRLMADLPEGWTAQASFTEFPVPLHETYPLQVVLNAPTGHANEWHKITWKIEAEGKATGSVELRVHLRSGGLPQ
ncbi:MAG TPA: PIG-L family deacetylase [Blastocatellia bacterium]|nr:PIG-L family deacetylase [Blastocatellia bacterium]